MNKIHASITREEFEEQSTRELQNVVEKAKNIRDYLRKLEGEINKREMKITNYQNIFQELQAELVKIQAMLYARGSI